MANETQPTVDQARVIPQISGHVEEQLRAAYAEVLHEPIPSRFFAVLDTLEPGGLSTADKKQKASDPREQNAASVR